MHVEGIVSKRIEAPYAPGHRGLWRKVKCLNRAEFVSDRSRAFLASRRRSRHCSAGAPGNAAACRNSRVITRTASHNSALSLGSCISAAVPYCRSAPSSTMCAAAHTAPIAPIALARTPAETAASRHGKANSRERQVRT